MSSPDTERRSYVEDFLDDFFLRPDSSAEPYGSLRRGADGVLLTPFTLTDEDVQLLRNELGSIATFVKQFVGRDMLALRAAGRDRAEQVAALLDFVADSLPGTEIEPEVIQVWSRALKIAQMNGKATHDRLLALERGLVTKLFEPQPELHSLWLADLLRQRKLAAGSARDIAAHLRALADEQSDPSSARFFSHAAAGWHHAAGDESEGYDDVLSVVRSLQAQAAILMRSGEPAATMKAAADLQEAFDFVRCLPQRFRASRGVPHLDDELAVGIRNARRATVSSMTSGVTSVDVSETYERTVRSMTGRAKAEAAAEFLGRATLPSYAVYRDRAEAAIGDSPLGRISRERLSSDGRRVSHTGKDQFGLPGSVWRRMVDDLVREVADTVYGRLMPAWQILSAEHHLTRGYFVEVARSGNIIPRDRAQMVGRALFYGFDGDFMSAAQLLLPQLEHAVRVHLNDAGVVTTGTKDGIVNELGLSSLMAGEEADKVLGQDLAFVVRALFCSSSGPNLRNEFAHGLFTASTEVSTSAMYAWWLMWKLAATPFSNVAIDVAARV